MIHVKGFSTAPVHVIISKAQFRAQGKVSTNVNRMDNVWKVPWKFTKAHIDARTVTIRPRQ